MQRRMPAEWEPHQATLLSWPHNRDTWPGEHLNRVEKVYLNLLKALLPYEKVHLLVPSKAVAENVSERLREMVCEPTMDHQIQNQLRIHQTETNDCWIRDYGPITTIQNGNPVWTHWQYNAWGGKYPPWESDNAATSRLAEELGIPEEKIPMVLEGGSVETNGEGSLITTESVLLNPNRNPHRSRVDIEATLKTRLGINQVIWLKGGIAGDDTDGHVDDITRFVSANTIVTAIAEDPDDPNTAILAQNLEILRSAKNSSGRAFTIETLPMPEPVTDEETVDGSEYLPASYLNFYVANEIVLVPVFGQKRDDEVLAKFHRFFPNRKIAGIRCEDLIFGQGGIHCITNTIFQNR